MLAEEVGVDVRVLQRENLAIWGTIEGERMRLIEDLAMGFELGLGFL